MKAALVKYRYALLGGPERQIGPLIGALVEEGYEVHLVGHRWQLEEGFKEAIRCHRVPVVPGASFLRVLSFALFASWIVEREAFDLVCSFDRTLRQDLYRAGEGCHREWLIRRHRAAPRHRPIDRMNPLHRVILFLEKRLFASERCRKVIANSRMVKEDILRHYHVPEAKIAVIYNGVDLLRFHPRNRERVGKTTRQALGLGPDERVLLLVGSGFERKGVRSLIHGAAEALAKSRHTPLRLIIAGKGNPRPYLALARRLGLREQIRFVGIWPRVEALYAAADAFVLPTLYDPFSNACLEAMASGLPVLTSEANGASELIVHGRSGLIVKDPMDPSEIGEKLVELFEKGKGQAMGLEARETAEGFPIRRTLLETLKIWQEVLAEKSRVAS